MFIYRFFWQEKKNIYDLVDENEKLERIVQGRVRIYNEILNLPYTSERTKNTLHDILNREPYKRGTPYVTK